MKPLKLTSYLFAIIFFTAFRGNTQESLTELQYLPDEIFPIKIDKFGCPDVKMEFKNKPVWIIWDTGDMTGLVLSKKIIDGNDLKVKDSIRLSDSEGNMVGYSYTYVADSIRFFNGIKDNVSISTATGDYNGLIGPKFIDLKRFTLDYQNKFIGISKHSFKKSMVEGEILSMVKSEMFPRLILVEGQVNGKRVLMELDTGKSRTVIDPELAKELNMTEGKHGVVVDNIALGTLSFGVDNAKLKGFMGISNGLPEPIRIGIGSDVLSKFLFTVDYEQGIVILKPIK